MAEMIFFLERTKYRFVDQFFMLCSILASFSLCANYLYQGDFGKDDWGNWVRGWYVDDLVDNWPSPVKGSWDVEDAVSVYRQVLAAAEDHSVVISAIGFATNLADLLRRYRLARLFYAKCTEPVCSGADGHSPLSGMELVAAKVKTVVWQVRLSTGLPAWSLNCKVCRAAGTPQCTAGGRRPTTGTAAAASTTRAAATGRASTR